VPSATAPAHWHSPPMETCRPNFAEPCLPTGRLLASNSTTAACRTAAKGWHSPHTQTTKKNKPAFQQEQQLLVCTHQQTHPAPIQEQKVPLSDYGSDPPGQPTPARKNTPAACDTLTEKGPGLHGLQAPNVQRGKQPHQRNTASQLLAATRGPGP
jgi:hypothetical protein